MALLGYGDPYQAGLMAQLNPAPTYGTNPANYVSGSQPTMGFAGNPQVLWNDIIKRLGRQITPEEKNQLISKTGWTGGDLTGAQGELALQTANQWMPANPVQMNTNLSKPNPAITNNTFDPRVIPGQQSQNRPNPIMNQPPMAISIEGNRGLDPNVINNEIMQIMGRNISQSEIGALGRQIGLQTGQGITEQNRTDALDFARRYAGKAGFSPQDIINELTQVLGRAPTSQEVGNFQGQVGYTSGLINPQQRTDLLQQVKQYMQGLPVTPTGVNPNQGTTEPIAAPANQSSQTGQPAQTELNRKRFDFGQPKYFGRELSQTPVTETGLPYQGGEVNMRRGSFNQQLGSGVPLS